MKGAPQHLRLAIFLASLISTLVFAATPAGTVIRNQAVVMVEEEVYYSNPVDTVVLPVCSLSIIPNGSKEAPAQVVNATVGGTAYLVYQIINTGNDSFEFALSNQADASSDWAPVRASIYLDINHNAQIDPGEQRITTITLDAGDSASLIMELVVPDDGDGNLFVTMAGHCPDAVGGKTDEDNYSLVRLRSGPALQIEKSFSPNRVHPGDIVHVTLNVRNIGDQDADGEIVLSDDLTILEGVVFVSGSASAPKGQIEYSSDGTGWSLNEPDDVSAIRLTLDELKVGEEANLEFDLEVSGQANKGFQQNIATAEGPGGPAQSAATIEVLPYYRLFLGPEKNPRAVGADDLQDAELIVDQQYCFKHTLENASDEADTFELSAIGLPEDVQTSFNVAPSVPLSQPIRLAAGEKFDFLYCVTASKVVDPFTVKLIATSETTGKQDPTYDRVRKVYPSGSLVLIKSANPEGTVAAGSEVTYTLRFKNSYPIELTHVAISDDLDDNVEYISSSSGGLYDPDRHRVRWVVDAVSAGEEWEATLTVRVKSEAPDDTLIENRFTLRAEQIPNTLVSNTTRNVVWSSQLLLEKRVTPAKVKYGDRAHYALTLVNPGTTNLKVTLTDSPDAHLRYVSGSSSVGDPEIRDGKLIWKDIELEAGKSLTVEYDMRVLAGAPNKMENVAVASGVSPNGAQVVSARATATVLLDERIFLPRRTTIIGRVFFDIDKDGRFDQARDLPLPGARILLSDGRMVSTDVFGNYAFRDLEAGIWEVVLDPSSAPFPPRPHPEAIDQGYAHRVNAWGLTVSDFPLEAPAGFIEAIRRTTVYMGPLRLDKHIIPLQEGYFRVVLYLRSDEPLKELTIVDPLPSGGYKTFAFEEFVGEKTITYDLEGTPVLTDPEIRWRYP